MNFNSGVVLVMGLEDCKPAKGQNIKKCSVGGQYVESDQPFPLGVIVGLPWPTTDIAIIGPGKLIQNAKRLKKVFIKRPTTKGKTM